MTKKHIQFIVALFCLGFSLSAQTEDLTTYQKTCIAAQKLANKALREIKYSKDINLQKKYYREAITTIDSALALRPDYKIALGNKYKYQYRLKDYKGLLETAGRLYDIRPDLPVYIMHKAKVYELMGKPKKAKKMYGMCINKFETRFKTINPIAISWTEKVEYAQTLYFYGLKDEANTYYQKIRQKYKDEPYLKHNKELLMDYSKIMKYWSFNTDGSQYDKPWHKKK